MLIKKMIVVLLFILSSISFAFAQTWEKDREREEQEQRQAEALKKLDYRWTPFIPDLREFVPKPEDSWQISIIRNGGWTHSTRILALVKSDGNFLCREDNLSKNQPILKEDFESLLKFVQNIRFDQIRQQDNESLGSCRDCTIETLVFSQRTKKNKVTTYQFNIDDFPSETSEIRQMFSKVTSINTCKE